MTARSLESRHPFSRVPRAIFVALGLCSASFVACTTTNDQLFEDMGIGDLTPVSPGNGGGGGGAALPVLTSPPSNTSRGPTLTDPSAVGGSGDTGSASRPPAADAGVTPPGGDAGQDPTIPTVGDGSCGAQCARNGGLCAGGTCFFDCQAPGSCA